jgi:hypothetical protein
MADEELHFELLKKFYEKRDINKFILLDSIVFEFDFDYNKRNRISLFLIEQDLIEGWKGP